MTTRGSFDIGVKIADIFEHLDRLGFGPIDACHGDVGRSWIEFGDLADLERLLQMAHRRELEGRGNVDGTTLFSYLTQEARIVLRFEEEEVPDENEAIRTRVVNPTFAICFREDDLPKFRQLLFGAFPTACGRAARISAMPDDRDSFTPLSAAAKASGHFERQSTETAFPGEDAGHPNAASGGPDQGRDGLSRWTRTSNFAVDSVPRPEAIARCRQERFAPQPGPHGRLMCRPDHCLTTAVAAIRRVVPECGW